MPREKKWRHQCGVGDVCPDCGQAILGTGKGLAVLKRRYCLVTVVKCPRCGCNPESNRLGGGDIPARAMRLDLLWGIVNRVRRGEITALQAKEAWRKLFNPFNRGIDSNSPYWLEKCLGWEKAIKEGMLVRALLGLPVDPVINIPRDAKYRVQFYKIRTDEVRLVNEGPLDITPYEIPKGVPSFPGTFPINTRPKKEDAFDLEKYLRRRAAAKKKPGNTGRRRDDG